MKKYIPLTIAITALAVWSLPAVDGKALYAEKCTKCHGDDGKGQTTMGKKQGAKDYSDPKVQDALTDAAAFKAIKEGFKVADKAVMKPLEDASDDDIKALVAHMRTFKK